MKLAKILSLMAVSVVFAGCEDPEVEVTPACKMPAKPADQIKVNAQFKKDADVLENEEVTSYAVVFKKDGTAPQVYTSPKLRTNGNGEATLVYTNSAKIKDTNVENVVVQFQMTFADANKTVLEAVVQPTYVDEVKVTINAVLCEANPECANVVKAVPHTDTCTWDKGLGDVYTIPFTKEVQMENLRDEQAGGGRMNTLKIQAINAINAYKAANE